MGQLAKTYWKIGQPKDAVRLQISRARDLYASARLAIPDPPAFPATAPTTHVTVLSNGATIASEDAPGASLAVGLYVGAGSKHEIPGYTTGAAHLLERCAFRATANRSTFRLTREAEVIGANLLANASREQMGYTIDCLKTHLPEARSPHTSSRTTASAL